MNSSRNAPPRLDAIAPSAPDIGANAENTASRFRRTESFLERIMRQLREIEEDFERPTPRTETSTAPAAGQPETGQRAEPTDSAWAHAVRVASLRRERISAGAGASVRTLAQMLGCSHGRVGELLQIHDAFPRGMLVLIGDGDTRCGEERLARLSYRQLRRIVAVQPLSRLLRAHAVQEAAESASNGVGHARHRVVRSQS